MKVNYFFNIAIVLGSFAVLHVYNLFHEKELTIEKAVAPLEHLSNARHAIGNKKYTMSIEELEAAIRAMRVVEKYADSTVIVHVDQAIKDLKLVENEIEDDSIVVSDLNRAFFKALNSIAYANLTISENKLEHGEKYKAMNLLNASFREMLSSLEFVEDEELRNQEEKAISDVRDFLENLKRANYKHHKDHDYRQEYNSINQEIEGLIH